MKNNRMDLLQKQYKNTGMFKQKKRGIAHKKN